MKLMFLSYTWQHACNSQYSLTNVFMLPSHLFREFISFATYRYHDNIHLTCILSRDQHAQHNIIIASLQNVPVFVWIPTVHGLNGIKIHNWLSLLGNSRNDSCEILENMLSVRRQQKHYSCQLIGTWAWYNSKCDILMVKLLEAYESSRILLRQEILQKHLTNSFAFVC